MDFKGQSRNRRKSSEDSFPLAQRWTGPVFLRLDERSVPSRQTASVTLCLKWIQGRFQQTPQRSLVRGCNRDVHESACADLRQEPLRSTGGLTAKPRKQAHPAADGADAYIIFTGPSSHTFFYPRMKKMDVGWGRAAWSLAARPTGSAGCLLFRVGEPTAICHAAGASTYSRTRGPGPQIVHHVGADEKLRT